MEYPLTSIITPCYNSEKFIKETIFSVLSQTNTNWELILVDDNSTDHTLEILKSFATNDLRIKIIQNSVNKGVSESRNDAIRIANSKYIAFLDSDDLWTKDKLEKQIDFMEKNNVDFSFTSYEKIDESSQKINRKILIPQKINYKKLLTTNYIGCLTAIYNCEKLNKFYFKNEFDREDYVYWLEILKHIDYAYGINDVLAYYRIRSGSRSSKKIHLIKHNYLVFRKAENFSIGVSLYYLFLNLFYKLLLKR